MKQKTENFFYTPETQNTSLVRSSDSSHCQGSLHSPYSQEKLREMNPAMWPQCSEHTQGLSGLPSLALLHTGTQPLLHGNGKGMLVEPLWELGGGQPGASWARVPR